MYVQILTGSTQHPDEVRRLWDEWHRRLQPGARGYLGSVAGVDQRGTFVAVVRFASADAARANGVRPAQTEWWRRLSQLVVGLTASTGEDVTRWSALADAVLAGLSDRWVVEVERPALSSA